jgi:hypothetical protein
VPSDITRRRPPSRLPSSAISSAVFILVPRDPGNQRLARPQRAFPCLVIRSSRACIREVQATGFRFVQRCFTRWKRKHYICTHRSVDDRSLLEVPRMKPGYCANCSHRGRSRNWRRRPYDLPMAFSAARWPDQPARRCCHISHGLLEFRRTRTRSDFGKSDNLAHIRSKLWLENESRK